LRRRETTRATWARAVAVALDLAQELAVHRGRGADRAAAGAQGRDARDPTMPATALDRCDSWYRDERGRIVANWPGYMREYLRATRHLAPEDLRSCPAPARVDESYTLSG